MRGAFGKPQGTVARVQIGQTIISVRTKEGNKASAIEALRRAKFKFPGRQKVRLGSTLSCCVFVVHLEGSGRRAKPKKHLGSALSRGPSRRAVCLFDIPQS